MAVENTRHSFLRILNRQQSVPEYTIYPKLGKSVNAYSIHNSAKHILETLFSRLKLFLIIKGPNSGLRIFILKEN